MASLKGKWMAQLTRDRKTSLLPSRKQKALRKQQKKQTKAVLKYQKKGRSPMAAMMKAQIMRPKRRRISR